MPHFTWLSYYHKKFHFIKKHSVISISQSNAYPGGINVLSGHRHSKNRETYYQVCLEYQVSYAWPSRLPSSFLAFFELSKSPTQVVEHQMLTSENGWVDDLAVWSIWQMHERICKRNIFFRESYITFLQKIEMNLLFLKKLPFHSFKRSRKNRGPLLELAFFGTIFDSADGFLILVKEKCCIAKTSTFM